MSSTMPPRPGPKPRKPTVADADVPVHGECDPWFSRVREVFAELACREAAYGSAVCVIVEGRKVVDLFAGTASRRQARPWRDETLVNVYSATKGVSAMCVHTLVDRGLLELSRPVARYWPEFAAHGKGEVTIAQLLSHQAGLAAVAEPLPAEARYDWPRMIAALERSSPEPPPGQGHAYHAQTFGFLLGELVRRVTGGTLGRYLREEIAGPRGIDFWIGLGPEHDDRVAHVTRPLGLKPPPGQPDLTRVFQEESGSLSARAFGNPQPEPGAVNTRAFRAAELPGSNGHGHARALAQLYAAAVSAWGPPLLSPTALSACFEPLVDGEDLVLRLPTRFSAGFLCKSDAPGSEFGHGSGPHTFGHPGMGGSLGCADPAAALGFGYVTNCASASIVIDTRPSVLLDACYACL